VAYAFVCHILQEGQAGPHDGLVLAAGSLHVPMAATAAAFTSPAAFQQQPVQAELDDQVRSGSFVPATLTVEQ
jgi:hypothetical protein